MEQARYNYKTKQQQQQNLNTKERANKSWCERVFVH